MSTIAEQIEQIEETLRKTPHHKATNGFIGAMRAKIARLKDRELETSSKGGGGGSGFSVKKQGDATVVLVGPPSAGKSTLINKLTNAESKVAPYAFTTVTVVPGMFKYREAYIQILDIPGLIEGAREGKGRGREVLSVARGADLLIIMSDVKRTDRIDKMVTELEGAGIRINKTPPQVLVDKKVSGGLEIHSNIAQILDKETIKEIAREYGIKSGDISIREKLTLDRLFDALSTNRVYIPAIFAINKIDTVHKEHAVLRTQLTDHNVIYFSTLKNIGLQDLIDAIWKALKFITVYLIEPDQEVNFDNPIIMKDGECIADVANKIGSDFAANKNSAKIWGSSAKFPGQEVSLSSKLTDKMQIRFI